MKSCHYCKSSLMKPASRLQVWLSLARQRALATLIIVLAPAPQALAARLGGAYYVDDAEIGKPGSCEIESWGSFALNRDHIAVFSPACVVNLGGPVELGTNLVNLRSQGEKDSLVSLTAMFEQHRLSLLAWYGIRVFTDHLGDEPAGENGALAVEAEWRAGQIDPYRHVARLLHLVGRVEPPAALAPPARGENPLLAWVHRHTWFVPGTPAAKALRSWTA